MAEFNDPESVFSKLNLDPNVNQDAISPAQIQLTSQIDNTSNINSQINRAKFNAPGSIFSKLNANANPETIKPDPTKIASKIDTTTNINSQINQEESLMDSKNAEYRKTRDKELMDPNPQANSTINDNIRNPKPVEINSTKDQDISTKQGSLEPQPRSTETEVTVNETSRDSSDTEQGWLERQAHKKINSWMSEAGSKTTDTSGEEIKDPNTSTQKSKKTGVGMVPALDRDRPKTSIPDANNRPNPQTPNIHKGPNAQMPKISIPKFSMPKMKPR